MTRNLKVILAALTVLTAVYLAVVACAQSLAQNTQPDTSDIIIICDAEEYKGEPDVWYTPEELGIISVWDFGLDNATWVQVAANAEVSAFLDRELPIFKYKDKFWKISPLSASRATPEKPLWPIPAGAVLGSSWIVTGVFLFHRKRKNGQSVNCDYLDAVEASLATSPSSMRPRLYDRISRGVVSIGVGGY